MLKMKWRWGTALITPCQSHSPNSTTLFWWQDGQKCHKDGSLLEQNLVQSTANQGNALKDAIQ
jgi:hypothetical protein